MKTIVKTERFEMVRAHIAAEIYDTTIENIKALKLGQPAEVSDEVADKMIAAGHAQEVN